MEEAALCDEELMERYHSTGRVEDGDAAALIAGRQLFPCYFGSALRLEGVDQLLEGLERYTQIPRRREGFGAKVYKVSRDSQGARLTWLKVTGGTLRVKDLLSREGEVLEMGEKRIPFTGISMGNPHSVIFLDQETEKMFADWKKDSRTAERRSGREAKTGLDCLDLPAFGPAFENHPRFLPQRTNTEFVEVCGENDLLMRVWERGSGETLACGTGACAVAVAAILAGYAQKDRDVKVDLLGGSLFIRWDSESGRVFMTGEAKEVFSGEIDLP